MDWKRSKWGSFASWYMKRGEKTAVVCAEVMENQGYLFRSGSVQELTKTLQILCREPELIERGRELADRYILERYNWDDAVKKTLQLYRSEKQRKTDRGDTIESSDGE